MDEEKEGQSRWRIGKDSILPLVIGIGAYLGLEALFVLFNLPSQTFYYLIFAIFPAIAIPMVMGAKYGPIVGFMTGFGGKILADALIYGGVWIWWPLGIGLMGFIPGLNFHKYFKGKYSEGWNLFRLSMYALLAAFVGTMVPALISIPIDQLGFFFPMISYVLPMLLIAACNGVIIAPIIARSIEFIETKYFPREISDVTPPAPSNITQIGVFISGFCFLLGFGLFIMNSSSAGGGMAGCTGSVPFGHEVLGNLRIALDTGTIIFLSLGIALSVVLLVHWAFIRKRTKNEKRQL